MRAGRLRCPECGISPIFIPVARTRTVWDWFTPLDGCPRCGYAYERESGYFLLATWGFNYGVVAGLGLGLALVHSVVAEHHGPYVAVWIPVAACAGAAVFVALVVVDPPRPASGPTAAPNPYRAERYLHRIHGV